MLSRVPSGKRFVFCAGCLHGIKATVYSFNAKSESYGHRPLHPHNDGTDKIGFSPSRQTSRAPSAKRREVLVGWVYSLRKLSHCADARPENRRAGEVGGPDRQ